MAECKSGSNTYLHYKCYDYLKPEFDKFGLGVFAPDYLAAARKKIKERYKDIESYDIFFNNITSYLKYDNLFYNTGLRVPCRYINYLLNEKVRERDMHLSNPDYGILKDFVKEFHISKGSPKDGDICSSEIKLLEYEEHRKMKFLYDLYDDYKSIVAPPKKKPEKYNPCDILSKIISSYNDTINNNQKADDDLISKLIELKKLIEINVLPKNQVCKREITHFSLSEKEEKEEKQRLADEQERQEKAKRLAEQKEQEDAKRLAEQEQQEQAKRRLVEQELQQQAKQRLVEREHLDSEGQRHVKPELVRPESYGPGLQYRVSHTQDSYLQHNQGNGLAESYDSQTFGESEHTGTKMEQSQDQSVLGQMQNAFSSIVHNVEPGPVLGVSGGMGVLFLLFKYTPVGSFFGGRRGRFRQIPRSFNGPFPGGFPGYEEYDGGYIGYSPMNINPLAE
ncbi:PIR protein [Plasmodium vivax]|nr:PIR protein [Plasmodium vivax]